MSKNAFEKLAMMQVAEQNSPQHRQTNEQLVFGDKECSEQKLVVCVGGGDCISQNNENQAGWF